MPTFAAPRAAAAKPAAAKPNKSRSWVGLPEPAQAKLDVGPAHDRFEAEADRVADSIVASPAGPAARRAISPLSAPGPESRRAVQREEKRPIEAREKKEEEKARDLSGLLQPKPAPEARREESKNIQAKSDPRPGPLNRDEEAAKAKVQTKREGKTPKKPDEVVQKHPLVGSVQRDNVDDDTILETSIQTKHTQGTLQRDNVDDDTILETSIQAKRAEGALQRETAVADTEVEQDEESAAEPVQRHAATSAGFTAPAAVESGIAAMRGGGQPLAPDVRDFMEPRFGHDLSAVRIHDGARAGELASAVHARAFTIGQDVFFGAGQYQPATGTGRALLAHELTHTIQQGGGSSRAQPARIQRTPTTPNPPGSAGTAASGGTPGPPAGGGPAAPVVFRHPLGELHVNGTERIIKMRQMPLPMLGGRQGAERAPKGTGSYAAPRISFATPWRYYGKRPRGPVTARQQWLAGMAASDGARAEKIRQMPNVASGDIVGPSGEKIAYLRPRSPVGAAQNFLLIGTPTNLARSDDVRLPTWRDNGEGTLFHVDHVHEMQLGGTDGMTNFWLLDQSSNTSSGSLISSRLEEDFNTVIAAAMANAAPAAASSGTATPTPPATATTPAPAGSAGGAGTGWFAQNGLQKPLWSEIRADRNGSQAPTTSGWHIEYLGSRNIEVTGSRAVWTKADIETGQHLDKLSALTSREIRERGLQYAIGTNVVTARFYAQPNGGFFRTVRFDSSGQARTTDSVPGGAAGTGAGVAGNSFYRGFAVASGGILMAQGPVGPNATVKTLLGNVQLTPDQVIATITGQPFTRSGKISNPAFPIEVKWRPEFGFGGYADSRGLNEKLARLSILGASPVEIRESGLTPTGELFANGEIVATKALFPGLRIPIHMRGNDVFISFPIPTDRLNFGPVHVTEAAIDMGFGEHGIFLGGRAAVAVDGVGSGTITARVTAEDTILEGTFNFNLNFLNPASATIRYSMANDTLALTLNAGVREGVLPGVASGQVTGHFSREAVELSGTLNLAPPLAGSAVTVGYTRQTGITIAASNIPLPISSVPGITDATLSVRANYNPDDGQWRVSGQGSARFAIPPATGSLTIAMDGPVVTITGTAAFQQGPASGSLEVRATNARLDEAGQPVEGQVAPAFSITGRGSASLRFGILTGTAGIELTRDGAVIISGAIALPPSHEVFARRSYQRELLHVEPPEFPIWGVSLAGVGIGIFGFVDARLNFDAFVGPGTLQNTQVNVTFELDKPEEAVVDGTASFVVPAGAGFTLDIGGGLRARVAVAYVQGRIGLDARLGLLAEARADVNLHWTQAEGLSLAASAHAEARPQFEVGVNASVTAGVDLLVTEVEHTWGPWRRTLGSFGPEMAVGVTMPIAWSERAGLDFSTDNIEITKPDIDFAALMTDGFMQLV